MPSLNKLSTSLHLTVHSGISRPTESDYHVWNQTITSEVTTQYLPAMLV